MSRKYEVRMDCEDFELKQFENECGNCQTDGHYLCIGCKHIAPFEFMELSDNKMRYYEAQEKASIEADELLTDVDFTPCSKCDGHQACEDFGCAIEHGLEHLLERDPTDL